MSPTPNNTATLMASRPKVGGANLWKADAGGIAALIGVSALAYFVGVMPLVERHNRAHAEFTELTAARAKALDCNKLLDATRKQLAAAKADVVASPLKLQPLGQLNRRLATIADVASHAGATLDDVQPGRPIVGTRFDMMPVRVTGVASYPAFAGFLHQVREQFPDAGIDAFDLNVASPTNAGPVAKFGFDLVWYTSPTSADGAAKGPAADAGRK